MATSIHEGVIRYEIAQLDTDEPVDTAHARILINNALHFADEAGQVLVAFPPISGRSMESVPNVVSTWTRITAFGPFALRVQSDGTPYPVVVQLAGVTSGAGPVTFRVALTPDDDDDERAEILAAGDNTSDASTSSTTLAWLTMGTSPITLTPAKASAMTQTLSTIDAVGGDPVSVRVCLCRVAVWGQYTGSKSQPILHGLYAREYIGA